MKRNLMLGLIAAGVIFSFPLAAGAQGNLHLGKLEIHPGVSVGYTYSDNINWLADSNKALDQNPEENILQVSPGVDLRFPTSHHLFRLGYNLSAFDLQKRKQTKYKNSAMGAVDLNFPVGLVVRLSDNYTERLFPTLQMPDQSGIVEYWINDTFAEVGYKLASRWSAAGRYKNDMLRVQDRPRHDRDISSWGGAIFLRVITWLSLFGEGWYGHVGYKEAASGDSNADFGRGFLGLAGNYPKTKFTLKVGYDHWTYRKSTALPDANELVAALELEGKPTPGLSVSVHGSRSVEVTFYEGSPIYVSTGGGADLTWVLFRKLAIGADLGYYAQEYIHINYAGVKRKDEITQVSPSVKYEITRWLRAQAGYIWRNRSSNVESAEFKENRVGASLNAVF